MGEEGGGGRRREEEGKRGKEESQHLQPITLQHAAPGSISLTSGRTLSHRRRWMRGGAERLRCRRVIGTLRGKQGCGVLPHYIPFSIAHYWGLVAWGHRTRENARYARGGKTGRGRSVPRVRRTSPHPNGTQQEYPAPRFLKKKVPGEKHNRGQIE